MAYSTSNTKKVSTNPFDAIMDELGNDEFKYDSSHKTKNVMNTFKKKKKREPRKKLSPEEAAKKAPRNRL